jgi:MoaA/NifB/PqqE/SkfB family radical SAM enzyme
MRYLGVIPFVEEFITITASEQEKSVCHSFADSRIFFDKMMDVDWRLGYDWSPVFGQRTLAQSKCQRPLYSFAIYPNGAVTDCPSHSVSYGNFYQTSLEEVIYTGYKAKIKDFRLCPCSVFYTGNNAQIPKELPKHLEVFRK